MTEIVTFKGESKAEGLAANYVPYIPSLVKMISGSNTRPPLLGTDDGATEGTAFEVDKMPFSFVPYLVFKEAGGDWEVTTPLTLCHYVKPDGDNRYNLQICTEAAVTNAKREQHNRFIVDTLRIFMKRYDCGTSAGLITLPPPPEDAIEARLTAIKKLTSDRLDTTKRAIAYIAQFGLYCGKDYEFDKAFEKANDVCYDETIKARSGEGKRVRVRLEGRPPSWWNGVDAADSTGKRVMWSRGDGHTFLTPNIVVVEAPPPAETPPVEETTTDDSPNPFDAIFASSQRLLCDTTED
jgi:hypothetical protein